MTVLMKRLKAQMEEYLSDEPADFRNDIVQQIFALRLIAEKARQKIRSSMTVL